MFCFLQTCGGDPNKIDDREGQLIFPHTENSFVQCKARKRCSYFLAGLCGPVNQRACSHLPTTREAAAWEEDHICLWSRVLEEREMLLVLILMLLSRQAFFPNHAILLSPVSAPLCVAQRLGQCFGRATARCC